MNFSSNKPVNNQLSELPKFQHIEIDKIEAVITQLLADNRQAIDQLMQQPNPFTWENLVEPLDKLSNRLQKYWSPVVHLHAVMDNAELRAAYQACIPKLAEYDTELGQNIALFNAYQSIKNSPQFAKLEPAQRKIIDNELRDFRLSGVDLPAPAQQRYAEIQQELATLSSHFEEHLLDATQGFTILITDETELSGLPESALHIAKEAAKNNNQEGWLLTLDFPCYNAVLSYGDNRSLRERMYYAYTTRASDQGPNAGKWDNSQIMEQILKFRHEEAQLIGYHNFVEYSLVPKMANNPEQVLNFLQDLVKKVKPTAQQEIVELRQFAKNYDGQEELASWDLAYYSEKLQEHRYSISAEQLRPYFPAAHVMKGMFSLVERLYGIKINEQQGIETWHPDVLFFNIQNPGGEICGYFYVDLYARMHKRGGAWMDDYCSRILFSNGELQLPVAYLTCNFTQQSEKSPGLLTHEEVLTLFHEFGHGLQHLLTEINELGVAGINGVAWDAVELPSQFMENWCWQRPVIDLIAQHYQTSETLPDSLWQNMLAAKNFHAGLFLLRQLEFALFDLRLHLEFDPQQQGQIQKLLNEIRKDVGVLMPPAYNRFQHSFSHIFAGSYGAGYYSYLWADVLASDAFAKFEEEGLFNPAVGQQFLKTILAQGGAKDAMDLFIEFRGRKPDITALLRHNGLS